MIFRNINYVGIKTFFLVINVNVVLLSNIFRILVYMFICNVMLNQ